MNRKTKAGLAMLALSLAVGVIYGMTPKQPEDAGSYNVRAMSRSLITTTETQPECNSRLVERSRSVIGMAYSSQWKLASQPTNAPCWKDVYIAAVKNADGSITFTGSDVIPPVLPIGADVVRMYFKCIPKGNSGKCR